MKKNQTETPDKTYTKTGLVVLATLLPPIGWGLKQVFTGLKHGFDTIEGKDLEDEED